MSAASNKTVIGLTGNIATGKTVVRKMLGHLGAYTIDADALTHRIMTPGGPGYKPIVDHFGKFILEKDGTINRGKLGGIVFSDPEALAALEGIIHPFVRQAVDYLIANSSQEVVVVEAIKLLESPLRERVDSIWVTVSSEDNQLVRLATKRAMSTHDARQRMEAQSPQKEKTTLADVVIENDGSFEDTWQQVQSSWGKMFPETVIDAPFGVEASASQPDIALDELKSADLMTERAKPSHAEAIAKFITRISGGVIKMTRMNVMASFGEKAFMLLFAGPHMVGVLGWQIENLVSRVDEVWLEEDLDQSEALRVLMEAIEKASRELQAEALLVFVDPIQAANTALWQPLNYQIHTVEQLEIDAWKEAARESQPPDTIIFFKQLRIDRILRPI